MKITGRIWMLFLAIAVLVSCSKDKSEDATKHTTTKYALQVPSGFPPPAIDAEQLTVEAVRLGRMLYYDPILSSNGRSCATCHDQSKAFSIPRFIHLTGDTTSVPAHINLAWKKNFLWEGAYGSIEQVCIEDFEPEFFNTNMNDLVTRLKGHASYPRLFYEAWNITDVSGLSHLELKQTIVKSIAQFINTMVSADSKYDRYMRNEATLTQEELRGLIIFNTEEGDCFHCHGSVLFTDNQPRVNGLDLVPSGRGKGLYNFTGKEEDLGKFLPPTLRNIELTAPYMHDGRFQTLDEVVEFYNSGVHQDAPNIDPVMTKPFKTYGLNLTPYDKQCLVAFLKTLTDTSFVQKTEYSNPL